MSLPALTEHYGLTPADIDLMTLREVSEYIAQLQITRQRQEGA